MLSDHSRPPAPNLVEKLVTNIKHTYDFVKSEFEKRGCVLLSKEYINNHTKLEYLCPNGCSHFTSFNEFRKEDRNLCPRPLINYERVKKVFDAAGYTLLSKKYVTAKTRLRYKCPEKHTHQMTFQCFDSGQRCPTCQKRKKLTLDFVKKEFAKIGYTLLSKKYVNNKTKLNYICDKGHKRKIRWDGFQSGQRCLICENEGRRKEGHNNWKGGVTENNVALFYTYADRLRKYQKVHLINEGSLELLGVECKYCGKIFVPKASSVRSRIYALEDKAEGEQHLYCSDKCKKLCPIFQQQLWPKDYKPYKENIRPDQTAWAKMVKTRDNYTCIKCGAQHKRMVAHHIDPVINNPIESLDIDNGVTLCKKCDKLVHKLPGCGHNELRCEK